MARNLSNTLGLRLTAFSFAALALAFPAVAAEGDEGGPVTGAKGLFFEQLEKPKENLNTGLRYWIEMKRNGTTQRVSNKTQFKAGDSIRFHVRSNINGYAYILLSNGSRGEQSVLFPEGREENRLESGREVVLPQGGALTFDENPGTEKLTLLLSRTPIDAQSYLAKPSAEKEITLIASAQTGSKDLVPARIYVAMGTPTDGPPPILLASNNRAAAEKPEVKVVKKVKKVVKKEEVKKVASTTSSATVSSGSSSNSPATPVKVTSSVVHHRTFPVKDDEGTTTVVSKQSSGVLHVDVDLDHI